MESIRRRLAGFRIATICPALLRGGEKAASENGEGAEPEAQGPVVLKKGINLPNTLKDFPSSALRSRSGRAAAA